MLEVDSEPLIETRVALWMRDRFHQSEVENTFAESPHAAGVDAGPLRAALVESRRTCKHRVSFDRQESATIALVPDFGHRERFRALSTREPFAHIARAPSRAIATTR